MQMLHLGVSTFWTLITYINMGPWNIQKKKKKICAFPKPKQTRKPDRMSAGPWKKHAVAFILPAKLVFITVKSNFQDQWPKYCEIIHCTYGRAESSQGSSGIMRLVVCLIPWKGPSAVSLSSWGPGDAPAFLRGLEAVGTGLNKNSLTGPKEIDPAFYFSWAASKVEIAVELKPSIKAIFFFPGRSPVSPVFPALPFPPRKPPDSDIARCMPSAGLRAANPMSGSPDFPFKSGAE